MTVGDMVKEARACGGAEQELESEPPRAKRRSWRTFARPRALADGNDSRRQARPPGHAGVLGGFHVLVLQAFSQAGRADRPSTAPSGNGRRWPPISCRSSGTRRSPISRSASTPGRRPAARSTKSRCERSIESSFNVSRTVGIRGRRRISFCRAFG